MCYLLKMLKIFSKRYINLSAHPHEKHHLHSYCRTHTQNILFISLKTENMEKTHFSDLLSKAKRGIFFLLSFPNTTNKYIQFKNQQVLFNTWEIKLWGIISQGQSAVSKMWQRLKHADLREREGGGGWERGTFVLLQYKLNWSGVCSPSNHQIKTSADSNRLIVEAENSIWEKKKKKKFSHSSNCQCHLKWKVGFFFIIN